MPLCEWGTSTIQALADAFLSSPRYVNRNARRGYADNAGHWRLATDSDSSPVARHAISADMYRQAPRSVGNCQQSITINPARRVNRQSPGTVDTYG